MKKYSATITGIGCDATPLMEAGNLCVIFNDNAPAALADISFLHTIESLNADVCPGDSVTLGSDIYKVLKVGDEANRTLRELGHCSMLLFDSSIEEETECLPGYIVLDCKKKPRPQIGQKIEIDG